MKTADHFFNRYTLDVSVKSKYFTEGDGRLETFGEDMAQVHDLSLTGRIWTVIEGDSGLYIVPGARYVNRIYYMVTTEPCTEEDSNEEFCIEEYDNEEE